MLKQIPISNPQFMLPRVMDFIVKFLNFLLDIQSWFQSILKYENKCFYRKTNLNQLPAAMTVNTPAGIPMPRLRRPRSSMNATVPITSEEIPQTIWKIKQASWISLLSVRSKSNDIHKFNLWISTASLVQEIRYFKVVWGWHYKSTLIFIVLFVNCLITACFKACTMNYLSNKTKIGILSKLKKKIENQRYFLKLDNY